MPEHQKKSKKNASLFERLSTLISPEPENRDELLEILQDAHERNLIDADSLSMIEGVFQVSELCARDIMIPRSQISVIDITQPMEQWLPEVIAAGHSRFPVIEGDRDKVIGMLMAKDLLRISVDKSLNVRDMIRPAVFIPGAKRLNVLLRDFRDNHNHVAIIVDEYGGVSGLISIEDVLEQIVGDIEDEYDIDEDHGNIIPLKPVDDLSRWRVRALTELDQFNEDIGTKLENKDVDTIGGLIINQLGRIPRKGEKFQMFGLNIEILRADARQIHMILVEKREEPTVHTTA